MCGLFADGLFHQHPSQFQPDGHPLVFNLREPRPPFGKTLFAIDHLLQLGSHLSKPLLYRRVNFSQILRYP